MKNLISKTLLLFQIMLVATTLSCQTKQTGTPQSMGLSNTSWELTNINNRQVITSSIGEGVFLTFEPTENRVSGFAGCNSYFGNYRFDDTGNLTFDAIGSTKKMCNNISVESEFLNMLRQVNQYEMDGQTLKLKNQSAVMATFTKTPYRK